MRPWTTSKLFMKQGHSPTTRFTLGCDNEPAAWDKILKLSDGAPAMAAAAVPANPAPTMRPIAVKGLEMARKQSGIYGLLIMEVGSGQAGKASRMSATHLETMPMSK